MVSVEHNDGVCTGYIVKQNGDTWNIEFFTNFPFVVRNKKIFLFHLNNKLCKKYWQAIQYRLKMMKFLLGTNFVVLLANFLLDFFV